MKEIFPNLFMSKFDKNPWKGLRIVSEKAVRRRLVIKRNRVDYALEGSKFAACFTRKGHDTPID